jgi:hypothetical protein
VTFLSCAFRRHAEFLFSADFGRVRVYESDLPLSLGTVACTRGSDIHLAPGAYAPDSVRGRDILGHELAHVLQQRSGHFVTGAAGWVLETEAAAAGRRFALSQPIRVRRLARSPELADADGLSAAGAREPVAQCYTVVAAGAAFGPHAVVVANPQVHAPVQVGDTFIGQVKAAGSFLTAAGAVNLVAVNPAVTALRISGNGLMAIENADLSGRQPKAFYATMGIINESNARLALLGSDFQLVPDPIGAAQQRITVGANTLMRVTPQNVTNGTAGLTMNAMQPCNQLVEKVLGAINPEPFFSQPLNPAPHLLIEYHVARELCPAPQPPILDDTTSVTRGTTMSGIAAPYAAAARAAGLAFIADIQQYGLNEYAAPGVGEGFVTSSLIAAAAGMGVAPGNVPPTYFDRYHVFGAPPQPMVVQGNRTWGSHWGGVVARDGTDVVTLENYARNAEDALIGNDTRYYFQLYETNPPAGGAGSWHQQWTSTPMQAIAAPVAPPPPNPAPTHEPASPGAKGFANPITMRVVVPSARYDALAAAQYGAVNLDTIKNDYNLIAGALTASAEITQVLKGLQYANAHLNNNAAGAAARVQQWNLALTNANAAARFRENLPVIRYTHGRMVAMRTH